ncbi:hypothetical protein FRC06_000095 [Ceratobasidium sp. 370]|nr:hypothetical protein FRC06_000095 [Ceratobasidium sp. 370]
MRSRCNPARAFSPVSLPSSPATYEARRLCPSSLVHPSSHAEYLLHHLERPVTREVIHYVACRIHQILSHTPVANFDLDPISVPPLETFALVLIRSTFITLPTIICALLYLDRLELSLSRRPIYNHNPTSPHCILLSVLIVASKHQNDSSLTNAAWCDAVAWSIKRCKLGKPRSVEMLINNVFSLTNIMAMERQCLDHLEFDLVVSEEEVELTVAAMGRFFASPTLLQTTRVPVVRLEEEVESWLHGIPPENIIPVTEDTSSQWFESPPSFQYLCTRRASAPAILDYHDQPAICGAPSSYAAFPSDVSDGASSYPATPVGGFKATPDFDIDELYEEVALDDGGSDLFTGDMACGMELPMQFRYPEPAMDEYDLEHFTRGRSTFSKPLGDFAVLPLNLRSLPSDFALPAPWMDNSGMPFIIQAPAN